VRLFVAVQISAAVREALAGFVDRLRLSFLPSPKQKLRWVPAENFHVTLKFIGHVQPAALDGIRNALSAVRCGPPFALEIRGLHFFPNDRRPRVFWAGVYAPPELAALAGVIDQSLEPLGIAREIHVYTPHLTLARLNPPAISEEMRDVVSRAFAQEFGTVHVSGFHLMESKLKSSGAEYTTLQTFDFATGV
jgi:RNA 2',3'-cyclic 3'-phosphodiesterase